MSEGWGWLKDFIHDPMTRTVIALIIVLAPYFIAAGSNLRIAILIGIGGVVLVVLLLQYLDRKAAKELQNKGIPDKEKDLLRMYIGWSKELQELFNRFLMTGILYYESIDNRLIIRTHMDRDFQMAKRQARRGIKYTQTWDLKKELTQVKSLIQSRAVKKTMAKVGEPYHFKLVLTKDGDLLLKNIRIILEGSD